MPSDTYTLVITDTGVAIPTDHASTHLIGGTDALPVASALTSGLMSTTIFNQHAANTATLSGGITATHLIGGAAGTVPYQTASGSTAMLAAGTSGYVLTAKGSAPPAWEPVNLSGPAGTLAVEDGGTGVNAFTPDGLVYANGTSAFTTVTKPSGDIVGTDATQTLTNKTMGSGTTFSSPISVANGGTGAGTFSAGILRSTGGTSTLSTVTQPAGDLVGTTATQTLTNKTFSTGTVLGTPNSGILTNCTGLPLTTGVTGTLPVANGGTGATAATGTGNVVLATSPALTTPNIGTPSAGVLTNCTGLPLTTGAGVTGTLPVANGGTGATAATGSGNVVLATSPVLTTPNIGTPSAGVLTSCTGLPLSTGVTGTLPVANGGTGVTQSAYGECYISTPDTTDITALNTWTKIAGTTTAGVLSNFTMPSNNRLTYTGTATRKFLVVVAGSAHGANSDEISVGVSKNAGTPVDSSISEFTATGANNVLQVSSQCIVELATNDYVEVFTRDVSAANDVDFDYMTLTAIALI